MAYEDAAGSLPEVHNWELNMDCRKAGVDPTLFEVPDATEARPERLRREAGAKAVCVSCEVRLHCLADALEQENQPRRPLELRTELGVRGGLTRDERTSLRKKRPGNPFGK